MYLLETIHIHLCSKKTNKCHILCDHKICRFYILIYMKNNFISFNIYIGSIALRFSWTMSIWCKKQNFDMKSRSNLHNFSLHRTCTYTNSYVIDVLHISVFYIPSANPSIMCVFLYRFCRFTIITCLFCKSYP